MELGLFIHWFPQTHDDPMHRRTDNITDPGVQREMMSHARLERFSARQWVQSALDLGAKYIVFVAKHGCGICRWQSQYGEMNFKNAPYKDGRGDPLAELAAECRRAGIRLGIYICASSATYGAGQGCLIDDPERQAAYTKIYKGWLSEVLGNYGDIAEVWFDGSIELKIEDVLRKAKKRNVPVETVPRARLEKLSERGSHQGVMAETKPFNYVNVTTIVETANAQAAENGGSALVVILDHITDAGNLGAIARSAESVGAAGIVIPNKRAAHVTAATYKSSAGAISHINVTQVANLSQTIERLKKEGFWVCAASEHAQEVAWKSNLKGKIALVMGSEGEGVSSLVLENCDFAVKLPQMGKVSSLNVAQASTVFMYEWLRQQQ